MPNMEPGFWNLIRFNEFQQNDKPLWLMRKDQCTHCADPGCLEACPAPGAIVQYSNGIVGFQQDQCIGCGYCITGCPFNVPKMRGAPQLLPLLRRQAWGRRPLPKLPGQRFDSLPIYIAEDFPHLRVECCSTCKRYLLCTDLLKDSEAMPLVDDITALSLHLWATDRGYTKIEANLLGF